MSYWEIDNMKKAFRQAVMDELGIRKENIPPSDDTTLTLSIEAMLKALQKAFQTQPKAHYIPFPRVVTINIGGEKTIQVTQQVLTQYPASDFARKFQRMETMDKDGKIFIDQSPKMFMPLIDFLRAKKYNDNKTPPLVDNDAFRGNVDMFRDFLCMLQSFGLQKYMYPVQIIPVPDEKISLQQESLTEPVHYVGNPVEFEESKEPRFFYLKPTDPTLRVKSFQLERRIDRIGRGVLQGFSDPSKLSSWKDSGKIMVQSKKADTATTWPEDIVRVECHLNGWRSMHLPGNISRKKLTTYNDVVPENFVVIFGGVAYVRLTAVELEPMPRNSGSNEWTFAVDLD